MTSPYDTVAAGPQARPEAAADTGAEAPADAGPDAAPDAGPDTGPGCGASGARRGRPRDAGVDQSVAEAVLRMVDAGATLGELSMGGIAREAGVGKATVYRRWPNKDALLLDVIERIDPPPLAQPSGVLREDLIAAVEYIRRRSLAKRESALLRSMLAEVQSNTVLWRRYHDTVVTARRGMLIALLERGIDSGEIRPELGADLDLLCDMVVGPVLARATLRPDAPLPDDLAERVVDTLLTGMRPCR
ncbi:TetR/AcrR family transcriptional regulator C-terminal ligand-binding domain-containing protein [Streptomyces sp. V4-01]|uniref:TetR/AcrR family transcriptional regulator C-terminal ligand-binding domain-containing protein n=1 Tax=Actinacidiphila polyblastidii TaxID=3110430 RepID=A0ABU7PEH4_9ACTN|nr:TetR/AcrR family transcriptional regulator C-terminal ligand-binding domain-containing protein [Streptomyces sp. V4-01]